MEQSNTNSDERLAKRASIGDVRANRAASDRSHTQNREETDAVRREERLAILRDVNVKLPVIPEIPGYHTIWLTTNNQSDSLDWRMRVGYELIKPEELPGFCLPTQQSGQVTSDRIMINEMVDAKIKTELAEEAMQMFHHDMPTQAVNSLKESVAITRDGRGREIGYSGRDIDGSFRDGATDGFRTLTKNARPSFAGVL